MRARRSISALEGALALPVGEDRRYFFQLMEGAFAKLGGPTIQREIEGCEAMQRHYKNIYVSTRDLPYNRDRQRVTGVLHRHVQLLNKLQERAAELARAEFYGMHGRDALASLPPWLTQDAPTTDLPMPAPAHEPVPAPEPAPAPEPVTVTQPATQPEPTPAESSAGDDQPVSSRYLKESIQRLREKGVSFEACTNLREFVRLHKPTRGRFKQQAALLMAG